MRSARYAGEGASDAQNNAKLLAELTGVPDAGRGAHYRCVIAFVRNSEDPAPVFAHGSWEGRIAHALRGNGGFGYDPLFVPKGRAVTAAEMDAVAKNAVSHRAQALERLLAALR
mgnify:FL=1